ncbi:hypothetical protein M2J84_17805 [Comamonas aquatica]|uniref:hypothetical protein n=1 Tax=Comamonas aquatica TaxID=225991 RepID=UPI0022DE9653|nr:hypothetical protein [Comamonas aquatica]MDH0373193.1 hypothetical protein [Comamonas aquatica]MDH1902582.1 hypothetical protein [Comamonas aquatica]WBM41906.1 hypothetical protein M2J84_17805 [Comamonas aquatica]
MPASATATDYDAFLHAHVHSQPHSVMRYDVDGESLWVKRAGATVPGWRLRVLGAAAKALRMPVLTPVPNPGGRAAMAIEVARLQDLQRRGLRVPTVLAHCADGFVMRHLGAPGQETPNLGNAMEEAMPRGAHAVLALWKQGLQAIAKVHKAGTCLSQAFARNLVRCPDGVIGYIDFEDDPAAHLPLAVCQVRDALCYAHSTAWILAQAGALEPARAQWQAWVSTLSPDARELLHASIARMAWAGRLPDSRRLGRDAQRLRSAFELVRADR